jgi:hypothetical protein
VKHNLKEVIFKMRLIKLKEHKRDIQTLEEKVGILLLMLNHSCFKEMLLSFMEPILIVENLSVVMVVYSRRMQQCSMVWNYQQLVKDLLRFKNLVLKKSKAIRVSQY